MGVKTSNGVGSFTDVEVEDRKEQDRVRTPTHFWTGLDSDRDYESTPKIEISRGAAK